jgi:hypothetical protein
MRRHQTVKGERDHSPGINDSLSTYMHNTERGATTNGQEPIHQNRHMTVIVPWYLDSYSKGLYVKKLFFGSSYTVSYPSGCENGEYGGVSLVLRALHHSGILRALCAVWPYNPESNRYTEIILTCGQIFSRTARAWLLRPCDRFLVFGRC